MKQVVIEPLTYMSLSNGQVPNKMKINQVIPMFKKGESDLTLNYRPISLLSVFDKLLENDSLH